MLKLLLFVLPLGLDTVAVSAALGLQGLPKRERLKVSLLLSAFEMSMPVVGLFLGRGLGAAIGGVAEYLAAVAAHELTGVRAQTHRRDRTRYLPTVVRNMVLRIVGRKILRSNYRPLRDGAY